MLMFITVIVAMLSVFFENSGLMKQGPQQAEFEPTEGNVVKFSDVQGVDEAKEVLFLVDLVNNVEIGI